MPWQLAELASESLYATLATRKSCARNVSNRLGEDPVAAVVA
jgi:hypothetical protein